MDREKLGRWLREATPEERQELADAADISVGYLYQMAGGHRDNFRLRTAFRIAKKSYQMHIRKGSSLPYVTLDDLYAITNNKG